MKLTRRQKFAKSFVEITAYSLIALFLLVAASISFTIIYALLRLVGLV